jgi:hypothetical protein
MEHSIHRFWYSLYFQTTAGGLGKCPPTVPTFSSTSEDLAMAHLKFNCMFETTQEKVLAAPLPAGESNQVAIIPQTLMKLQEVWEAVGTGRGCRKVGLPEIEL